MKAIPFTYPSIPWRQAAHAQPRQQQTDSGQTARIENINSDSIAGLTRLEPNQILRLDRHSKVSVIEVHNGVLWVTDTPSEGDILLLEGENLPVHGRWPVVLQALTEATIRLC